jgi:HK97 family phage portal protein
VRDSLALLAADEARTARAALSSHGTSHTSQAGREARSANATSSFDSPQQWLMNVFGSTTRSGAQVSEDTAFNVSTVRACINFRANLRAMLPVKLFRKSAKGPEEQTTHPVSRLLRGRVGPGQNTFQWRHYNEVCTCLGGNGYTRIWRDTFSDIKGLQFMPPVEVEPRVLDSGTMVYKHRKTGAILQDFEVLHNRALSTNGLTGRSPLHDLREAVGLALTAQTYSAATFANGNRQPGVMKGPATMNSEKAKEFLKVWNETQAGAANAGKAPFLFGGIEWANAGFSNQDAELLMSRKFDVEEIARVYGVPLHIIGSTEKATTWGSGIEQLNRGLVDYVVTPMVRADEIEMTDKLLTEKEKDDGFYIRYSLDALLRGSLEQRAKIYEILRRICAIDVNQIRELEEWSQYPDAWAGDPRQPLNAQQSGQGAPAAAAEEEPAADEAMSLNK